MTVRVNKHGAKKGAKNIPSSEMEARQGARTQDTLPEHPAGITPKRKARQPMLRSEGLSFTFGADVCPENGLDLGTQFL